MSDSGQFYSCIADNGQQYDIEVHNGIRVLRDDKLPGGTKSVLLPHIIDGGYDEVVYATPVYGGFQIALSKYCKAVGKQATIFCAQRKKLHPNTIICQRNGAKVIQVPHGYLSVVEKAARAYVWDAIADDDRRGKVKKIEFGAKTPETVELLAERVRGLIQVIGCEPDEIWCAVGSGLLVEAILKGTSTAQIHGVCVGAPYENTHERLILHRYPAKFEQESKAQHSFPSMPNYDLKAWEMCRQHYSAHNHRMVYFWNVL